MADKYWNQLSNEEQKLFNRVDYNEGVKQFLTTGNYNYHGRKYDSAEFLKNAIYTSPVDITSFTIRQDLRFENCYFLHDFTIRGNVFGRISFAQCVFESELIFKTRRDAIALDVHLVDILIQKEMRISNGNFNSFFASFKNFPTIKLYGGIFKEIGLGYWGNNTEIKEVWIDAGKIQGVFKLYKSKVHLVHLYGINKDCELYFENIAINSFNIYQFRNEKRFRIQNITPLQIEQKESELVIYDSNLGNAEFYETDLRRFSNIIFHDSFLADSIFLNIDWPNSIEPYGGQHIPEGEKKPPNNLILFKKKKDNYRQIKFALGKQGDTIGEHLFHGLEMSAYNKAIKVSWKTVGTKMIIFLSKFLSNYGQSLARPFWALIIGNWIFFIIMILFFGYRNFQIVRYDNIDWKVTFDAFAELLRLCNPLHSDEMPLNGGLLIWDLLSRIWSSYMVYNIIRATRRFIK